METQNNSMPELREFNERILTELHRCSTENRVHTDRQVAELRKHTDEQVEKLRDHTDKMVAELRMEQGEQRKYFDERLNRHDQQMAAIRDLHDQQMVEMRKHHDQQMADMRKHHDAQMATLRGYTDHQVEILRAEAARREDKFDTTMQSLRNDMTNGFRWTAGAILTLAGLMIATYTKLLGLY